MLTDEAHEFLETTMKFVINALLFQIFQGNVEVNWEPCRSTYSDSGFKLRHPFNGDWLE
uniref:Uncharacterized protein n=1 Tax=Meloidogyne hapla TaxID=6305 RepID=A0A1I8B068_MELHA